MAEVSEPSLLLTLRWRGLDSNFQYASAMNLVVAPASLGRVGAPFCQPILSGTQPNDTRSAIAVAGSLCRLPTLPKQTGAAKGRQPASPRPRTGSSNPVPSSGESGEPILPLGPKGRSTQSRTMLAGDDYVVSSRVAQSRWLSLKLGSTSRLSLPASQTEPGDRQVSTANPNCAAAVPMRLLCLAGSASKAQPSTAQSASLVPRLIGRRFLDRPAHVWLRKLVQQTAKSLSHAYPQC
jgi:hypothetical protein